jgi:hypothetical protein
VDASSVIYCPCGRGASGCQHSSSWDPIQKAIKHRQLHKPDVVCAGNSWGKSWLWNRLYHGAFAELTWYMTRASVDPAIPCPDVYTWTLSKLVFLSSWLGTRDAIRLQDEAAGPQHFHSSSVFFNWQLISQLFGEKGSALMSKRFARMSNIYNYREEKVNHNSSEAGWF